MEQDEGEEQLVSHRFRAAAMTIRTVLLSLQALLATPEPDDPQDAGEFFFLSNDRSNFALQS